MQKKLTKSEFMHKITNDHYRKKYRNKQGSIESKSFLIDSIANTLKRTNNGRKRLNCR